MKVGVLCEESGVVREAFRRRGHDAWSCDILPRPSEFHICGDCLSQDWSGFDLLICFPPCTHLASSGAGSMAKKRANGSQQRGIDFFLAICNLPCPCIAVENPVGIMSTVYRKPDQIIQPWQFGHAETKATCLWLKNLPLLAPTRIVEPDYMRKKDGTYYTDAYGKRYSRIHFMSGRKADRSRLRSKTYQGIAEAMADQWGGAVASRPAFTLLELLIVIVIISIILSIALPALRHSREAARDAQCLANIRTIGQLATVYHDANRSRWPRQIERLELDDGIPPLTCPRDRTPDALRSHGLWEPAFGMAAGAVETPTLEARVEQASPPGLLMVVDIRAWCDRQKTHRNGTYTGDNAPRRIR